MGALVMNPTRIVIHHSATAADIPVEEISRAHIDRGFDAIGYHYLVTAVGEIVAGRPEHISGAHARGLNQESLGVCCIGNFDETDMPEAQWNALVSLVADLARRYAISAEFIIGHSDVVSLSQEATPTRCPGERLYSRLATLRSRIALCCKPDYRGSKVIFEPTYDGFIIVSGLLRGRQFERALDKCPHDMKLVKVVLTETEKSVAVWSMRAPLTISDSGEREGSFEVTLPQVMLQEGQYECIVLSDEEAGVEEDGKQLPHMQFRIQLPLREVREFSVPIIRAEVETERVKGTGPFIVRLKGHVINTGSSPWVNTDDHTPFRVGVVVFAADGKSVPCIELRYDLPLNRVEVGQQVPFSFTFDIGDLLIGEYYAHVDMVRERCYWFTRLGSIGDSIRIEVKERRKERPEESTDLLDPPNSWATSPDMASVLYIAPTLPLFDRSTGGRRLLDMFRILRNEGVRITFLYEQLGAYGDTSRYTQKLDQLGVEHFPDPLGFLSELQDPGRFNLVVLGWHSTASAVMATVRDVLPQVRVAVDSVDIQWEREVRAEQKGFLSKTAEVREADKARERRAYAQADEVWVVSEDDAEILGRELPAAKWRVVGVPCPKSETPIEELYGDRVLFVGGFAHPPNESSALWTAEIVGEFNARNDTSLKLDIVGSQPPTSVRELGNKPNITVHGFVPSLDDCHRQAKIFLAPLTYGGGVKGKISDAICRGVPVITNAIGNEGLGLQHGKEILLGETTEDFVRLLGDVHTGRYDLEKIRNNAINKLQSLYGEDAIKAQMLSALVAPHVVIGIVTYNQRELLRLCLHSILSKTSYQNFTIAVISNGCSDGSQEMLREFAEGYPQIVQVHYSDTNNFFVRPCNQIISQYPQSDVILMNNDVEVINPGWLTNLVDAAYSSRFVCGSGGLVFDSDGVVSEAGAEIYSSGMGRNLYRGSPALGGAALAIRSVGFVSGCLMYMRRDAIRAIGALDEEYHPMYFEDVAWHYTAHSHGLKTLYTPWARIIHKEGSSAGQDVSSGMKRYQEINRKKFLEKFKGIDFEQFNCAR